MQKIKIFFYISLFSIFTACNGNKELVVTPEHPEYDFLKASATLQQQPTMRTQRDMAFDNAKFTLKTQIQMEIEHFLSAYLKNIGVTNEKMINRLSEYVYMDMAELFDAVEQSDIKIMENRDMKITVAVGREHFKNVLMEALKSNFRRDRSIWDRFQEQTSQDLLKTSLERLISPSNENE